MFTFLNFYFRLQCIGCIKINLSSNLISKVALTRQDNRNLLRLLHDIECIEIPCISFKRGPDFDELCESLSDDVVVAISSPQV